MPNYTGSFGDVVSRGIKTLTSQTNIRQMAPGSKARAFIEVHAKEISNLSLLQDTNIKKAFLPTTYGQFLDHFGATVGLTRYPQRNAEALEEDRVFRFYVRGGGTFGSINNGIGFTIPDGTRLTSPSTTAFSTDSFNSYQEEPDNIYDRSIHYLVTGDFFLSSNATEAYVSARAITPGAGGNIAAPKMIKTHDFVGYGDYLGKTLLVENTKPVLNGFNEESEASYRYRISKEITAAEKANYVAIVNAARSVPGVADIIIIPWEDGAGRFNVYIKSISSIISSRTIEDVQTAINNVLAVGTIGYARKPYEIGVEIDTTLTFKSNYDDPTKYQIKGEAETILVKYLNSFSIGQPLILAELADELKQSESRIATVGFSKTTFFDGVFIWYPAKLADGGRRRERLITDSLIVPAHARITAETSISDPIRVS